MTPRKALAPLRVWDRLTVGPATIETRRITAPYTVERTEGAESITLSYTWDEDVFDPADPQAQNLAALILAQVALNYGLFCRELVLHGPLDERDRRFLADMAANTAREIYVNRFLKPNPFLIGPAAELPVVKGDEVPCASLKFPDAAVADTPHPAWGQGRGACAVLSSGGKDSLLSFGLLDELAVEAHPIFVNESGRHWFTALNAYRNFQQTVPHTGARLDQLRPRLHLDAAAPAVRPPRLHPRAGGRSTRSGCGPWPCSCSAPCRCLRKRGIDRLVIGDEYDTSTRVRFKGITHYDGLYDQSRWFDQALSRYFQRKGWQVHQFSMLRPLSELLIEKILVERYPDLQRHQVSCHATHKDEASDRVLPCGKCEKCRRIVGMLSALGADPRRCGYTPEQIEAGLAALHAQSVKQESAGAEQMILLLHERGLWHGRRTAGPRATPRSLQLRIDPEHAPLGTMPRDLRGPVLRLCLRARRGRRQAARPRLAGLRSLRRAGRSPRPTPFEQAATAARGHAQGQAALAAGRADLARGRAALPRDGRRAAAGGRHRAARPAPAPGHRRLRRRLARASGGRRLQRPQAAGAAADPLRRVVPPRGFRGTLSRAATRPWPSSSTTSAWARRATASPSWSSSTATAATGRPCTSPPR